MYEDFYGLRTKPFQMIPDPEFIYWSESHLMAFTMLRYGILSSSPMTVITGDVGTGKTTMLNQLMEEFPKEYHIGLLSNVQAGKGELLEWSLMAFEQPFEGSHVQLFQRFENFLLENYAQGRQSILIIDEAHNLSVGQLEELRILLNVNQASDLLLQIILIGQPELRAMLGQENLRQFAQRITSDFHLAPLERHEIQGYIQRRLSIAGCDREIFAHASCNLIFHATRGIPRLINVLCDLCMVYGFSADRTFIDEDLVRELMSGIERNGIFNQLTPLSSVPKLVASEPGPRMSHQRQQSDEA